MAEQSLTEDAAILRKVNGKVDDYLNARIRLALAQGHLEEARALMEPRYANASTATPLTIGELRDLNARAEIALKQGDGATAISLSQRLQERLRTARMEAYLNVWRVRALVSEGAGYLLQQDPKNAVLLLQQATDGEAAMLDSESPELGATEARLGTAYLETGNRHRARSLLASAESRLKQHKELSDQYRAPMRELARRLAKTTAPDRSVLTN
jgi:hypothetical protein